MLWSQVCMCSAHAVVTVAGLVAAEIVPVLLLGPVAGVVIDRFSRKAVLIGADIVRAALALSLVWPQGVWHAYLVAAGLSAGSTFFNPTVQAVIPALTTEKRRLAANSVAWSTAQLVQIVAAGIVGGIIAFVGTGPAFALNAASFVASALLFCAGALDLALLGHHDFGVPLEPREHTSSPSLTM